MRYHHTKNKGDLGTIKAMADMTAKGWRILPFSEHEPYDFVAYNGTAVDLVAIYVPETERCYYFDPSTLATNSVSLRIEPARNNNKKRIAWARDYMDIPLRVRGISGWRTIGTC
jgi:hypothetical protein